jgi:hypothetical protein
MPDDDYYYYHHHHHRRRRRRRRGHKACVLLHEQHILQLLHNVEVE